MFAHIDGTKYCIEKGGIERISAMTGFAGFFWPTAENPSLSISG